MQEKYLQLWQLARPYYERGRPMDIDHIEWMMEIAKVVCAAENLDAELLLPMVILHDVGYAEVPKDNPFKLDVRKAHMVAGAIIAKRLLDQIEYPEEKAKQIVYFISVHDNWAFEDNALYNNNKLYGIFNDLDFMWMATPKGFPALLKILHKTPAELFDYVSLNDKLQKRPLASATTRKLFEIYINDRKHEYGL